MLARWNTAALFASLTALVAAVALPTDGQAAPPVAPRVRPKKPPVKKPPEPAPTTPPAPSEPAGDRTAPEPVPAAAPAASGGASTTPSTSAGDDAAARPGEAEPGKPGKPGDGPDVDSLRQEYLSLRDELFKSRARANAVASQLYSTRIQIKLTYTTARYYNPARSSIRLDGASVYEDTSGAIGGDDGVRFDGYVAPGRHLITFHVEATGKDDDSFSSTTESQIVVKAVAGKDLMVWAKAKDAGDIAYQWKRSENGSYGLGIDVAVKAAKLAEPAASPPAGARSPDKADKK
jgi:hypothetical protein